MLWSVERPLVGASAVHIPGAMLRHRTGLVPAVLPASKNMANGQWGLSGNLGGPDHLQATFAGRGDRLTNPRPAVERSGPLGAKVPTQRLVSPSEGNEARRKGGRESHRVIVP
jgi:hypothetical protein